MGTSHSFGTDPTCSFCASLAPRGLHRRRQLYCRRHQSSHVAKMNRCLGATRPDVLSATRPSTAQRTQLVSPHWRAHQCHHSRHRPAHIAHARNEQDGKTSVQTEPEAPSPSGSSEDETFAQAAARLAAEVVASPIFYVVAGTGNAPPRVATPMY